MLLSQSLIFIFLCSATSVAGQEELLSLTSDGKRSNILVESREAIKIRARLKYLSNTSIILDASKRTPAVDLNKYYIRPYGDFYRVDVEYIKSISINKGKKLSQSAMSGGVLGAITIATLSSKAAQSEGLDFAESLGQTLLGGAVGLVVGSFVGGVYGLFTRKKIVINGQSLNLYKLEPYFQFYKAY
jgi:hypothetical protein